MAGMSRIAADIYLGDTSDLERAATVYQGWLGDRAKYAAFKYGGMEWQADTAKPVGINPKGSVKNGKPVDGCMPDDQRRSGGFEWPPPAENYVRGSLGPCLVAIEMLRRTVIPPRPPGAIELSTAASSSSRFSARARFRVTTPGNPS